LPPTYVFEDLRGVLLDHVLRADLMTRRSSTRATPRGLFGSHGLTAAHS
jgi:hypothetical protein